MYRTCIFCHAPLGANEALENFPVARRVAFDAERGRLWAVCGACERWNLSPIETRWEAIEEAERLYRDTRTRVATEQIGLARVADGTGLVRIGRPLRPEFAAWRYGDQFGRRARRFWTGAGVLGVTGAAAAGLVMASAPVLVGLIPLAAQLALIAARRAPGSGGRARQAQLAMTDERGEKILTPKDAIVRARILPGERDWALELGLAEIYQTTQNDPFRVDRKVTVRGGAAVRALGTMLPSANRAGGSRAEVQSAVARIEAAGDPERYFRQSELDARSLGWGYRELWQMPAEVRLALEMSAHEDSERRALEGELEVLEQQWRDAEAIAAVADTLAIPPEVERRLKRLR
jgi:hypothetical protein